MIQFTIRLTVLVHDNTKSDKNSVAARNNDKSYNKNNHLAKKEKRGLKM